MQTRASIKLIGRRAFKISVTGIFLGGLPGILTWWTPSDLSEIITRIQGVFWGLIVLPTATLWVIARHDLEAGQVAPYLTLVKAWALALGSNLAGTALASVFFSVVALNATGVLGDLDLLSLYQAWKTEVLWGDMVVILTASVVGAGVVGLWAHQCASSETIREGETRP